MNAEDTSRVGTMANGPCSASSVAERVSQRISVMLKSSVKLFAVCLLLLGGMIVFDGTDLVVAEQKS
jgi:hypothetical protein